MQRTTLQQDVHCDRPFGQGSVGQGRPTPPTLPPSYLLSPPAPPLPLAALCSRLSFLSSPLFPCCSSDKALTLGVDLGIWGGGLLRERPCPPGVLPPLRVEGLATIWREFCQSTDALSPATLKRLINMEGGCSRMAVSSIAAEAAFRVRSSASAAVKLPPPMSAWPPHNTVVAQCLVGWRRSKQNVSACAAVCAGHTDVCGCVCAAILCQSGRTLTSAGSAAAICGQQQYHDERQ